jgi:hypothetical protein
MDRDFTEKGLAVEGVLISWGSPYSFMTSFF